MLHGLLLVDKPQGVTSHDVVAKVRRLLKMKRVGHAGTLDPMATGLLIVALGEACKLVDYLMLKTKSYRATLKIGHSTNTLDAEGDVDQVDAQPPLLTREAVEQACSAFIGTFEQQVPAFSAVKVQGERLYARARRGDAIETLPTRQVYVESLRIISVKDSEVTFDVTCGKGFFVRSLGRDLAHALNTHGHLSALRRTSSGPWSIEQAIRIDELESLAVDALPAFIPFDKACAALPLIALTSQGVDFALKGRAIPLTEIFVEPAHLTLSSETSIVTRMDGLPLAIVRRETECLRVIRGFSRGADQNRTDE